MSTARRGPVRSVSDAEKRRTILLLRGLLVVAVGGLLADTGLREAGLLPLILVVGFALSNAVLAWAPAHLVGSRRFELVLGALDLLLVGLGIQLAGAGSGALPVSCLLMTLVAALAEHRANMAAGAAAVGALHAWLALGSGATPAAGQLALQILFLCAVGLHYATLTEGVHHRRRRERVEELQQNELRTLVEILDSVSSTLDEVTVAQTVVSKLDELVPSLRCSLLHIDDRARCFVLASHDKPDLERLEIDLDKYPEVREALATREPVVIADSYSHPLTRPVRERLEQLGYRSIAVLPLRFGEEVLGVLALRAARHAEGGFSRGEIGMCRAVARASANAMKNAVLHRRAIEESEYRRVSGEKLSRILNHSPDLILTTDAEGRIAEANRAAERVLGFSRDELLGREASGLLVERTTDLPGRVRAAGVIPNLPVRLRRQDGGEIEVELHLAVLDDGAARPGALWIGRDITELKAAQLQLLQAEKLSTVGKVISGVAHELNNPLSAVLGYSQLVLSRGAPAGNRRELERIHEAALRCQKIVKNLLSFARHEKPERKRLGINGILEKTLDLKKYQLHVGGVDVVREFAPELPMTLVDFHQMQQVFLNLFQNAQQAIHAARRDGKLVVRTTAADGTIRVEIADNGTGMDAHTLEHVFDPFFTTKQQGEGTGLGLSVSYGIVQEHGGRIWAKSREGVGTSFFVELPVVAAAVGEVSDAPRPTLAAAHAAGKILVVDDEPLVLDLLVDVLEAAGHRVDTASNGDEACRKVGDRSYDMVITDVHMPRMSGLELYREILGLRPELKDRVVFVTGDLIDDEVIDFLAQVNARTLPKPLDLTRLTELVQQTLPR